MSDKSSVKEGGKKMEFEIKKPSFMDTLGNSSIGKTAKRYKITVAASMAV